MSDIFEQMIAQHTIAGDNDRVANLKSGRMITPTIS